MGNGDAKEFFAFCELKTPPLGAEARLEAGELLRSLQEGEVIPRNKFARMHGIGNRCYELYIHDGEKNCSWRLVYHIGDEVIVVLDLFKKKSKKTPQRIIDRCRCRMKRWENATSE